MTKGNREIPLKYLTYDEGILDRVSLYFPVPEGAPEAKWRGFVDSFRAAA